MGSDIWQRHVAASYICFPSSGFSQSQRPSPETTNSLYLWVTCTSRFYRNEVSNYVMFGPGNIKTVYEFLYFILFALGKWVNVPEIQALTLVKRFRTAYASQYFPLPVWAIIHNYPRYWWARHARSNVLVWLTLQIISIIKSKYLSNQQFIKGALFQ